jgi:tRNA pseudouridine38-40 synthase
MYKRNGEIRGGAALPQGICRVALGLEYAGSTFSGFQRQKGTHNTIQEKLERALSLVAAEPILTVCAGRTDAGVSATEQVIHFDTEANRPDKAWIFGANTKLPSEIRIRWAKNVGGDFHARFGAKARTYRYLFVDGSIRPAVLYGSVTAFRGRLDLPKMEQASQCLIGTHDFTSLRSSQCDAKNPVREIQSITWHKQGQLFWVEIKATAFLHHMVRNIMGSLFEVGRGARPVSWMADMLSAKNRCEAGPTAGPNGLYFVKADYDSIHALPLTPKGPMFLPD